MEAQMEEEKLVKLETAYGNLKMMQAFLQDKILQNEIESTLISEVQ